jgi:hypothetical protein
LIGVPQQIQLRVHAVTKQDSLRAEYAEVNANFRMLADIRFKLLAFVPTISGAGIALVRWAPDPPATLLLGVCGFIVTFALTAYDQRNSQLYNDLVSRAKFLEAQLNAPARSSSPGGQFTERPQRSRKLLGLALWHDFALALVYAVALGGWLFVIVAAFLQVVFMRQFVVMGLAWLASTTGTTGTPLALVTDVVTAVRYLVAVYVAYRTAVFVFWRLLGSDALKPGGRLEKSPCKPVAVDPSWKVAEGRSLIDRWRCRVVGL